MKRRNNSFGESPGLPVMTGRAMPTFMQCLTMIMMRLFWAWPLLLLLLIPTLPCHALLATTPEHLAAIKIQEAIFNREYSRAQSMTRGLNLPAESPFPTLIEMTILLVRMSENLNFSAREGDFNALARANETLCTAIMANPKPDVWPLMLCGAGHTLKSFMVIKNGGGLRAVTHAKMAMDFFDKVKKNDPDNLDVELGSAMYNFFKSEFTETKLSFIPFLPDKRDESIAKIEEVSRSGVFAKNLADFILALIAEQTSRKELGQRYLKKLVSRFPGSILFRVMQAAFYIKTSEYQSALGVLDQLQKIAPENAVAKYFRGRALALEGSKLDEAKTNLMAYLDTNPEASVKGPTYYLLGLVAEKQGKREEAMEHYKRAYDIYPKYKASLKSLLRLRKAGDGK